MMKNSRNNQEWSGRCGGRDDTSLPPPTYANLRERIAANLPLVGTILIGVTLSLVVFIYFTLENRSRHSAAKDHLTAVTTANVALSLQHHLAALDNLSGVFLASDSVERTEFTAFWDKLHSVTTPGLELVCWIPRVSRESRDEYERAARLDGFRDFSFLVAGSSGTLEPVGQRPEYYPLYYVEAVAHNPVPLGFDLFSDNQTRDIMQRSLRQNAPLAASSATGLPWLLSSSELVVIKPLLRDNQLQQRETGEPARPLGYLAAVVDLKEILLDVAARSVYSDLDLTISSDSHNAAEPTVKAGTGNGGDQQQTAGKGQVIHFAGRDLLVSCVVPAETLIGRAGLVPVVAALVGLLLTVAFACRIRTRRRLERYSDYLEEVVAEKTRGLRMVNHALKKKIVDSRKVEDALRRSEQTCQKLYDQAQAALFLTDFQTGKMIECNEQMVKLLGYDSRSHLLSEYTAEKHYDDLRDFQRIHDILKRSGRVSGYEMAWRRLDGSEIWVRCNGLLSHEGGHIEGGLTDITSKRTAELALQRSQQMLRLVLDNVQQMIFWTDRQQRVLGCNSSMLKVLGVHDISDIAGMTLYDLPGGAAQHERIAAAQNRVLSHNSPEHHQVSFRPEGASRQRLYDLTLLPLHDLRGEVIGVFGTYQETVNTESIPSSPST